MPVQIAERNACFMPYLVESSIHFRGCWDVGLTNATSSSSARSLEYLCLQFAPKATICLLFQVDGSVSSITSLLMIGIGGDQG